MIDYLWTPRVGDEIRRKHDPDAPIHTVTSVRGSGPACTVRINGNAARWWDCDIFEPVHPRAPPAPASVEARLNESLANEDDFAEKPPVSPEEP